MDTQTKSRQVIAEQILDRLANDEDFRKELLDNPNETLEKLGYTPGEVTGYGLDASSPTTGILCQPIGGGGTGTTAMTCPSGGGHPVATTGIMCPGAGTDPSGGVTAPPPGAGTTAVMCPTPPATTH